MMKMGILWLFLGLMAMGRGELCASVSHPQGDLFLPSIDDDGGLDNEIDHSKKEVHSLHKSERDSSRCGDLSDTAKCYNFKEYRPDRIVLKKLISTLDTFPISLVPIFADVDGDCVPEMIVGNYNAIEIYSTETGRLNQSISTEQFRMEPTNICAGDVDDDGKVEIIVGLSSDTRIPINYRGRIVCLNLDGSEEWVSDEPYVPLNFRRSRYRDGNLALADFNMDGNSEVYIYNNVFNGQTGALLVEGQISGMGLGHSSFVTIAGQLDDDQFDLEIAAGHSIYKVEINNVNGLTGNSMSLLDIIVDGELRDGKTCLADINADGRLDVVVHSDRGDPRLYVYSYESGSLNLISSVTLPDNTLSYPFNNYFVSTPAIGDVDGSGQPSVVVVRENKILCYKYNGGQALNLIWSIPILEESARTGVGLFDFNGDGINEIVQRDQEYLRIIDGSKNPPVELSRAVCRSGSRLEGPVIVDALGESTSNICVICGDGDFPSNGMLTIFGSPDTLQPWAPARNIWNQYAYHVYNINDDLTVPRVMKNNATEEGGRYNGFMMQQSLLDTNGFYKKRAASLHGLIKCVNYDIQTDEYEIIFDLYNRSDASLTAWSGFPVGFFDGDPQSGGSLLGVYTTTTDLPAGDSLVNLSFTISGVNFSQLFMMVNSDETTFTNLDEDEFFHPECDFTDNLSSIFELPEVRLLSDSICAGENYVFLDTTLMDDGIYYRELQDQEGCDSVCARLELKGINCNNDPPNCGDLSDTTKCYIDSKFNLERIELEIKHQVNDSFWGYCNFPLADIDFDCHAEIFGSQTQNNLSISDISSGTEYSNFRIPFLWYFGPANYVIGDVFRDGEPVIILAVELGPSSDRTLNGKIICLRLDGTILWVSDEIFRIGIWGPSRLLPNLGLADFNQDGVPEVYTNNRIYNAQTGALLCDGGWNGIGTSFYASSASYALSTTSAADLDDNPNDLELAAGYTIYDVDITNTSDSAGNRMIAYNIEVEGEFFDGRTSVADINMDGKLDVIVNFSTLGIREPILYAYYLDGMTPELISKINWTGHRVNGERRPSTPAIGLITENDTPDILILTENRLRCYEYNGTTTFSEKWTFPIDEGSGSATPVLFDFNNDGYLEIVVNGDFRLSIIDGRTSNPQLLASHECFTPTIIENPSIGNVVGDDGAEICVFCAEKNKDILFGALTIFGSPDSLGSWAPAPPVWNQYAYHALSINDDLTVPQYMKNKATYEGGRYNNFMAQRTLLDSTGNYKKRAASLHGLIKCVNYDIQTDEYEIIFDLYNRSDASLTALAGFPVGFFDGDPQSGGSLLGIYRTTTDLPAGDSLVNLSFTFSGFNFSQLFMMVNSDETTFTNLNEDEFFHPECDFTDNLSSIFELPEVRLLSDSICAGENYDFLDTTITDDGIYFRELQDQEGCDSVCARLELKTIDSVHVVTTVMQCDSFIWKGETIKASGMYSDQFVGNNGCDSTITLELTITKSTEEVMTVSACDYYLIQGDSLTDSGTYTYSLTNAEGCDSTLTLALTINHPSEDTISRSVCQSFNWKGNSYDQSGFYRFDTLNQAGCDSTITLALEIRDTISTSEAINICEGDSVLVFGVYVRTSQELSKNFVTSAGCDSIHAVNVIVDDVYRGQRQVSFCEGDSVFVIDRWISSEGQYDILRTNAMDCDSVIQVTVSQKETSVTYDTLDLCEGDTLMLFGQSITEETDVDQIYTGQNGCDSTAFYHVKMLEVSMTQMSFTLCPQDSVFINGQWIKESMEITERMQGDNGCDSLISYSISQVPTPDPPTAQLNCENGTVEVRIDVQNNWRIEWDNGDTTRSTTYQNADEATVRLTTLPGCELEYTIDLPEIPVIGNISFPKDTVIANGTSIVIDLGLDPTEWKVLWSPRDVVDCDTCMQVTITPNQNTRIVVQLTHISGCVLEASFAIELDEERIFVPNVFTPNGDGLNDFFEAYYSDQVSIESCEIYDRWGELIYRSELNSNLRWDGTFNGENAPSAVYTYKIVYKVGQEEGQILAGDVTLMR